MIAAIVLALAAGQADSLTLCVEDAVTRAPVSATHVTRRDRTGASAFVALIRAGCRSVPVAPLLLRHVGYHAYSFDPPANAARVVVALSPLSEASTQRVTRLATSRIEASRIPTARSNTPSDVARMSATLHVDDAQSAGGTSSAHLLSMLPFTFIRSARGETGVSLRGARREQVPITLDGMPLSDPSTGIADVADLPLVAIGSATVTLGADAIGVGPGAAGGVIALESASRSQLSVSAGSFGKRNIEGAWQGQVGTTIVRAAASHKRADNDFEFINDAGASDSRVLERRVNNDETRSAVSVGATGAAAQISALASTATRGMVGAANVRTYDQDRSGNDRLLVRAQVSGHGVQLVSGLRTFALRYRDPTRSEFDANARALAADGELSGRAHMLRWRAGFGGDRLRASGGIEQSRGRTYVATDYVVRSAAGSFDAGARVDAIGTYGALPSFNIAGERTVVSRSSSAMSVTVGGRIAQAVRVPTLYDLYFSSPQRLFVRSLRPERVTLDGELLTRIVATTPLGAVSLQASLVARNTKDAIVWFPGNFGWSPANVGEEQLRGAEARARLGAAWGELSAWSTFYNALLLSDALRIPTPYVPRVAAGTSMRVNLPATTTLSIQTHLQGRRPFSAGPRDPAYELPAVFLGDVALSRHYHVRRTDALISFSLDNATNAQWQSVRGFPSPGRSWAIATTLTPILK